MGAPDAVFFFFVFSPEREIGLRNPFSFVGDLRLALKKHHLTRRFVSLNALSCTSEHLKVKFVILTENDENRFCHSH